MESGRGGRKQPRTTIPEDDAARRRKRCGRGRRTAGGNRRARAGAHHHQPDRHPAGTGTALPAPRLPAHAPQGRPWRRGCRSRARTSRARRVRTARTVRSARSASSAPPRVPRRAEARNPSISDLLREGQEIIVQIAKEPMGKKGARITSHIALPGRFLVYMPTVDHIGVSRKIASDEERLRLKRILQSNRAGIPGGFIVRTAGEGRTRGRAARRHPVPVQPVAGHPAASREEARAGADPSRPRPGRAHPARPGHRGRSRTSGSTTRRSTSAFCAS